jgi:hypothetical protein
LCSDDLDNLDETVNARRVIMGRLAVAELG